MSTNDQTVTQTIEQWLEGAVGSWVTLVLGVPFVMLWAKHGYSASMRDGDFFLYSVTALLAACFEWLMEQPSDLRRFLRSGDLFFLCYGFAALGGNLYLFVDAPGDDPSWVLNTVFWLAVVLAYGMHVTIKVEAWTKYRRVPDARGKPSAKDRHALGVLVFVAVLVLAVICWVIGQRGPHGHRVSSLLGSNTRSRR